MISREHAKEVLENLANNEDIQSMLLRTDIEAMKCAISELSTDGEYIKKADMEKILYSTNNAVRIGELFIELPTYSFPSSSENKGKWDKIWRIDCECSEYVCSKCGCGEDFQTDFCPNCGADMRGE